MCRMAIAESGGVVLPIDKCIPNPNNWTARCHFYFDKISFCCCFNDVLIDFIAGSTVHSGEAFASNTTCSVHCEMAENKIQIYYYKKYNVKRRFFVFKKFWFNSVL